MSDKITAWLRTIVPGLWAALLAWLVKLGLPAGVVDVLGQLGEQLVVPAVLAVVYPVLRGLESRLPDWLRRVLLGSAREPSYGSPAR